MMKKFIYILLLAIILIFVSCNPDSMTSIPYDKLHGKPSTDYRVYNYVGDYVDGNNTYLVLGTNLGICLYDVNASRSLNVIVNPISHPVMLVGEGQDAYVIYYEQTRDKDAILKAANISELLAKQASSIDAQFVINGNAIDAVLTNVFMLTEQTANGIDSIKFTVQEKQAENQDYNNRSIIFHNFSSSDISFNPDTGRIEISNAVSTTAKSSVEAAPYIVGDGYIAYLDEDESYYKVFKMENDGVIDPESDALLENKCRDNEIIAFYFANNNIKVLVDNSGDVFVNDEHPGDYGSFPRDNRRVAYGTIVNNNLLIGFKYGPEIVTVDVNSGKTDYMDTSDINNETIVGIKYFNGSYFVVTEESGVIKTDLK